MGVVKFKGYSILLPGIFISENTRRDILAALRGCKFSVIGNRVAIPDKKRSNPIAFRILEELGLELDPEDDDLFK